MRRIEAILAQRIEFLANGGQERVQPQTLMIVELFVTQRQPIEALRQQLRHRVIHINLLARLAETLGHAVRETKIDVHLAQEQRAPSLESVPPEKSATTLREPRS
jgi:hypothetical protein